MSFLHNDIYGKIPEDVLNTDSKQAEKFVSNLIQSAVPPRDYCPTKYSKSILLLKRHQKPKRRPPVKKSLLSRKEKKQLKLLKCPKTGWNYQEFLGIKNIWKSYIKNILQNYFSSQTITDIQCSDLTHFNNLLAKADYHGAEMKIIGAKNPSLVGLSGICIIDSKNTFKILSEDDKCRTVPKNDCVFQMKVDDITLTVYGKHLTTKPAERATKKLKSGIIPDL